MVVIEIPDILIVESFTELKKDYINYKSTVKNLRKSIIDAEIQCENENTKSIELVENFKLHTNIDIDGLNEFELENHYDIQDKIYKEIKQEKTNIEQLEGEIITNNELLEKELINDIEIKYLYNILFQIKDYIKDNKVNSQISFLNHNLTNFLNLVNNDTNNDTTNDTNNDTTNDINNDTTNDINNDINNDTSNDINNDTSNDIEKTTLIEELTNIVNNQNDYDNILLIDDIKCSLIKNSREKQISNYINIQTISVGSILCIFFHYYTFIVSILIISGLFIQDIVQYEFEKTRYKICSNVELLKTNRVLTEYINNYSFALVVSILSFYNIYGYIIQITTM